MSELEAQVKTLEEQVCDKDLQLEEMHEKLLQFEAEVEANSANSRKELEEAKVLLS